MRTRTFLLLVSTVILLPAFIASGVAVSTVRDRERAAALNALTQTVRATALLVDGQVERSLGSLTLLANSRQLQEGNFAALYEEAKAADRPPDVWTLLLDDTGIQRFNTRVPFDTPPPPSVAADRVAKVLATQQPLVSDVIRGPVTKSLLTTIYFPAKPSTAGRFVVAQTFSVQHWKRSALQPEGRADWVVGVLDRNGRFVSRSQRGDELVGELARPELIAAAASQRDGLIRHHTLEGVDVYDAFTHSSLTGWTVAVAAPVSAIESSATQAIVWLATGVVLALGLALIAATFVGQTMVRAMQGAARAARALGEGSRIETGVAPLEEVRDLNRALHEAANVLEREQVAREAAQAERERLLDNERATRETAERESAAKDQFLALLGHELRNPLAAIIGATRVIRGRTVDDVVVSKHLSILERQGRHLVRIVDDLLDLRRMLMGKMDLTLEELDLAACTHSAVEAHQTTERAAHYRFVTRLESVSIKADPVRLEQVISNLLANAVKFSPKGSDIVVTVRPLGNRALLEIADQGTGIPAHMLTAIFEPFVQAPTVPGRINSGLGIGLALVRQIVELHGGEVIAKSDGEGRGTAVTISLPALSKRKPGVPPPDDPHDVGKRQVLLVEDNRDNRTMTADVLRELGYGVREAEDSHDVDRHLSQSTPDAIVMDLGLPGKSGFEIAAELKRNPAFSRIPLIALSGMGQERDRKAAAEAGFAHYLVKPSSPEAIACAIEESASGR